MKQLASKEVPFQGTKFQVTSWFRVKEKER